MRGTREKKKDNHTAMGQSPPAKNYLTQSKQERLTDVGKA